MIVADLLVVLRALNANDRSQVVFTFEPRVLVSVSSDTGDISGISAILLHTADLADAPDALSLDTVIETLAASAQSLAVVLWNPEKSRNAIAGASVNASQHVFLHTSVGAPINPPSIYAWLNRETPKNRRRTRLPTSDSQKAIESRLGSARAAGRAAAAAGRPCAPALCRVYRTLIAGEPIGGAGVQLAKAWTSAYTAFIFAQPLPSAVS